MEGEKNDDDKERTNVKLVVKNKIKYHVKIKNIKKGQMFN